MGKGTKIINSVIVIIAFIAIFAVISGICGDNGYGPGIFGLITLSALIFALKTIWKNNDDNEPSSDSSTQSSKDISSPMKKEILSQIDVKSIFSNKHTSGYDSDKRQINEQSNVDQRLFMICYNCNKEIPSDSEFCPICGIKLYETCPKCGKKYSSQYKICNKCGTVREEFLKEQRERQMELLRTQKEIEEQQKEQLRKQREIDEQEGKQQEKVLCIFISLIFVVILIILIAIILGKE
jgi:predicted RNA-binding Zn-ribbon protein involved in translation (DUF1610 family)